MKKIVTLLLTFIFFVSTARSQSSDSTILLKEHFEDGYHVVFVVSDKSSIWYSRLTDEWVDKDQYNLLLKEAVDSFDVSLKTLKLHLDGKEWFPLHRYKGKDYLYVPSDAGTEYRFLITDSTIVERYFDPGVLPSVLLGYNTISAQCFQIDFANIIEGKKWMRIHFLDKSRTKIVIERPYAPDSFKYTVMIEKSKLKEYPIIVNYSKSNRTREWEFDIIDYRKFINNY